MADRLFERTNRESRDRLAALAALLAPDQLSIDIGDGWTVSVALAHLAFWDRWQVARWRDAEARGLANPGDLPEVTQFVNASLEVPLAAIPGERAAAMAVTAADEVDALVAGLPDASIEAVSAGARGRLVDRSLHRREHLDQIERALENA